VTMRFPTPIRNNPSGIERKSMFHERSMAHNAPEK